MRKGLVSVVIPTHNRREMVVTLIESILKSSYKNTELVVVDDASTDGTYNYLISKFKNDKRIRLIHNNKNLFAAESKNIGKKYSRGEFIAFIDDDNLVDRNMLEYLVKFLQSHPEVGEVGPVNYFMSHKKKVLISNSKRNMWTTRTTHTRTLTQFRGREYWETDDIPNAFMVRKSVIDHYEISFRKKFGIMYEESDFAYRIRKAGFNIYFIRDAKIYHDVEMKDKDFITHFLLEPRRGFTFARNRILFHAIYSSKLQFATVLILWCWVFTVLYCFKFFLYRKNKTIKYSQKVSTICNYFLGTIKGIILSVEGNANSYLQ